LGREPQPGFLLASGILEESLIPLIETVARLYQENTPPPKRLKFLVRQIGQEAFRDMVFSQPGVREELPIPLTLSASLVPVPQAPDCRVTVPVFAGELSAQALSSLAEIASRWCGGMLMVTGDQDVVLHLAAPADLAPLRQALAEDGFGSNAPREQVVFRVCPGNHECIMGLAPTRDIASALLDAMGPVARGFSWAISGCPNCCAQPQLSQAGVVVSRLVSEPGQEGRTPRFDLYRAGEAPFAEPVQQGLTQDELVQAVKAQG
jgi:ferredoxin-nitrite reductase